MRSSHDYPTCVCVCASCSAHAIAGGFVQCVYLQRHGGNHKSFPADSRLYLLHGLIAKPQGLYPRPQCVLFSTECLQLGEELRGHRCPDATRSDLSGQVASRRPGGRRHMQARMGSHPSNIFRVVQITVSIKKTVGC